MKQSNYLFLKPHANVLRAESRTLSEFIYTLGLMAAFPFAGHELEIYKLHSTRKSVKGFPCVCLFPMNENIPLSLERLFVLRTRFVSV